MEKLQSCSSVQGFEARGTDIKGRDDAVKNLFGSSEVYFPGSRFNPRSERKKKQASTGPTGCYSRTLGIRHCFWWIGGGGGGGQDSSLITSSDANSLSNHLHEHF